jgi:hypothetical protein
MGRRYLIAEALTLLSFIMTIRAATGRFITKL